MTERGERFRTVLANRNDVLRVLADRHATKPELVDALDTSRATVDRAIRELQSFECITRNETGYVATMTGRLALAAFDQYDTTTRAITDADEFLNALDPDAPLDPAMLTGANVTLPEPHAPEQALKESIELIQSATQIRGIAPVVLSFYPELLAERVQEDDVTVEIIAESDVLATLPTLAGSTVDPFLEHDAVTLYESAGELPYALWLLDTPDGEYVGITAYEEGAVAGVLVNDSAPAVRWAEAQYDAYLHDAREITPSGL